jgi:hypothetical protein
MDDDQTVTPITLQADCFGENPKGFFVAIPACALEPAEALGILGAQYGGHLIDPAPLSLPLNEPRGFQF